VAVVLVIVALAALGAGLVLIILPLLYEEASLLAARRPRRWRWPTKSWPLAAAELRPAAASFDVAARCKSSPPATGTPCRSILERIYSSLKIGGVALVGLVVNLLLAPVVLFYLLLDWHGMIGRLGGIVPRPWHEKIDQPRAGHRWGALAVPARPDPGHGHPRGLLHLALWLADIPSALSIGVVTGLLIFIPYLGYATGLILALLVAALQFAGWGPIVAVLVVYGIGQVLESFVLTPFLVGERIGLHPLAVIFALMAFGQLFGFFGVLAALPASAALLVGLREMRALYLDSRFYRG
jgi:predicted PurR-regulated permease PerM